MDAGVNELNFPNSLKTGLFSDKVHRGAAMDMSLIVAKGLALFPEPHHRLTGSIDVWWVLHDGGLLLLISFLLKQHKVRFSSFSHFTPVYFRFGVDVSCVCSPLRRNRTTASR